MELILIMKNELYRKNDVAEVARDVTQLLGHIHFSTNNEMKLTKKKGNLNFSLSL